jgi:hypothetical protein
MSNTFNAVYQYAVVRFMPFIETREFANVGVVLIAPKTGKFLFKLAPIPVSLEAAALLAALTHPNHLVRLSSWG